MDLRPKRSFVEYVVSRGIPVFMISWRNPGTEQRDWDFDTYGAAALRAMDVAREVTGSDDVNVLGFCAGGILTASVTSHVAQTSDPRINSASFGVTLLDFDVPATIGAFQSGAVLGLAAARSNRQGVITGRNLGAMFALLRPNELVWNYWVNNYLLGNDPPVFDILAWNADSTNLPAKLHSEFIGIFGGNKLVEPDGLEILGTPVDLSKITVETYVTGATTDHLTPWKGCYRTTQLTGGESTFILSNAGHVASLVNPPGNPKAHYFAGPEPGPDPEDWLAKAEKVPGTWWEHWADWIGERSGEERRAPASLGSRRHRPIEPAPGSYVRDMEPANGTISTEEPALSRA
jgi:polyhydroxyalkanoate synthase